MLVNLRAFSLKSIKFVITVISYIILVVVYTRIGILKLIVAIGLVTVGL